MTTKELLALVGKWRDGWHGPASNGYFSPHGTGARVALKSCADELEAALTGPLAQGWGQGLEHIGWEGRTVWPGVEPAGWWGMANRPDETPLAHPHTQHRRIYAGPVEPAAPAQPDGVE